MSTDTTPPTDNPTPPAPALPEELRDDVAEALGVFFEQPDDAEHAEGRVLGAVARHWPRPAAVTADARELAEAFHDAYERLAPSFGYTTRTDTRKFDPDSSNGKLMQAVVAAVLAPVVAELAEAKQEVERLTKCPIGMEASHKLCSAGTCSVCVADLRDQLAAAQAQAREAMADKERLDWLEQHGYVAAHHDRHFEARTARFGWSRERFDGQPLRAAIDAARREGGAT